MAVNTALVSELLSETSTIHDMEGVLNFEQKAKINTVGEVVVSNVEVPFSFVMTDEKIQLPNFVIF